jgi:hypothetical protein
MLKTAETKELEISHKGMEEINHKVMEETKAINNNLNNSQRKSGKHQR